MPTRDVVFNLIGHDGTTPAFNRAAASAEGAAARISRAGDRMGVAGRKMTHTLTLPIIGIAAASVKAATSFDASMTRIETQAGASRREVQFLTKEVLGMRGAQFGPNAAAASLYHLESVGIRGRKAILDLKQAEDLAAVGGADLAETTNALAGAWRTGIRGARDFHEAAATINAVIGAGNMTLPDLTAALGTGILPSAKTFGLTLKDVGSALALFTDEGVPADAAATRLRMTFSLLGAPTGKAQKQLKSIGITQYELANDMRRRNGLIVAVGDLKSHLDDSGLSATKQAALLSRAFGGGRSSSAILSLVNNYEVLRKKQEQVTRTLARYDHAVKVQAATPQAQFKRALATLEQTGVLIGRDLLPLVVTGAQDVEHLAKAFDSLSPSQKHVAIDALLVVAALGPVLTITGRLVKVFGLASTAAVKAATFMAAPYQTTATQAQAAALRIEYANAQLQSDEALTAAAIARAKAAEAASAETAAVRIAVAAEDSAASMRLLATQAAEDAIEFNYAMQAEALAAQKMAVQTGAAAETAQLRLSTAMAGATRSTYGMQAAITGLTIGATVGSFTRGMSTMDKSIGVLASTAASAAIGFSMGGPLGAAIGGLGGLLSSGVAAFLHFGHSERQAIQPTQDFTSAIQQDNDALGRNTRLLVANSLEQRGLYDSGLKLGIGQKTLTNAVMGNRAAMVQVNNAMTRAGLTAAYLYATHQQGTKAQYDAAQAADKLRSGIGDLNQVLNVNQRAARNIDAGLGKVKTATDATGGSARRTTGYLGSLGKALDAIGRKHPHVKVTVDAGAAQTALGGILGRIESINSTPVRITAIPGVTGPGLIGAKRQAAGTMATFGRRTIPPNTAFTVGERGWEGGVTDAYGRASIFPANQAMAMGFRAPTPYASGTGEHATKPREVRIKDGRVEIDADSQGRLFAVFRGLILDELDYSMGH